MFALSLFLLLVVVILTEATMAFQIPHAGHHHPLYIRYRQEQFEQSSNKGPLSQVPSTSDLVRTQGSAVAISEEDYTRMDSPYSYTNPSSSPRMRQQPATAEVTIATPVSYDEETGMVQTAVRAIVQHP